MPDKHLNPSASVSREAAEELLRKTFGFRTLRPGQWDVIHRVLQGENTLAVMPTGAGKSLCYQLPALMLPGMTVVISPLVALMKDQCDTLRELGIETVQLNSAIGHDELEASRDAIEQGRARIVLTTPEQIADPNLQQALAVHKVSLLVVDEAHCISHWGHDFRPAFLEIAHAVTALRSPPVLALTATAKPAVKKEIIAAFSIAARNAVTAGAYRSNLDLSVEQLARAADRLPRILELVASSQGTGIVYTATVKCAQEVYDKLLAAGQSVGLYHGRMSPAERMSAQDDFMAGSVRVMVATNAFGLGIDKPDIRFVLHYQMPASVDAYYQEAGRAGRDGQQACCTLLYVRRDRALQQFFMAGRYPGVDDLYSVQEVLRSTAPDGGWTPEALVSTVDRPRAKALVALSLLRSHRAVRRDRAGRLSLVKAFDKAALQAVIRTYEQRREQDGATLEAMVAYSQGGRCRWHAVLTTLGEQPNSDNCGHCDNCRRIEELSRIAPAVAKPQTPIELRSDSSLKSNVPRFNAGESVRAKRYGAGRVVSADANAVTVEFPNGAQRSFLPEFVRAARSHRQPQPA